MNTIKPTIEEWAYKELDYNISPMIAVLLHQDLSEGLKEELIDMGYGLPDYEAAATDEGWERFDAEGDGDEICYHKETETTSYAESWEELCETQNIDTFDYAKEVFEYWLVSERLANMLIKHGEKVVSERLANMLIKHGEKVVKEFLGLGPIWCRTETGQAVYMDTVIEDIYAEAMSYYQGAV